MVEYGFIDNVNDIARLENNILDYAEAVVRAVAEVYDLPYVAPVGSNTYVVKSGDSLYSIARQNNTTVDELKILNNLTSNILQVGQILRIPSQTPTPETPEGYAVYTVKANDNLYAIANQYNVTVNDIVDLNQLDSTFLTVGQQLLIPSESSAPTQTDTIIYTVKPGDSLWKISQQYGITIGDLSVANNLTSPNLQIGDTLIIPGDVPIVEPEIPLTPEVTYIVQSGDSLYSIAKKYNISVNELKQANNLSSNLLSIGQQLAIPTTEEYITYYVKSGDSLWKIAQQYNTTVDAIKSVNNLTSNNLKIGQVLIIP